MSRHTSFGAAPAVQATKLQARQRQSELLVKPKRRDDGHSAPTLRSDPQRSDRARSSTSQIIPDRRAFPYLDHESQTAFLNGQGEAGGDNTRHCFCNRPRTSWQSCRLLDDNHGFRLNLIVFPG